MKKSLLTILLALAIAVPAFASEKGDINVLGKLGVAVNPAEAYSNDTYDDAYYRNPALSIAVEGLYYLLSELPVGLGINYQFDSQFTKYDYCESGATNIYLTVKPTAKIDSKIFTALYLIGQIGYGLHRYDASNSWEEGGETVSWKEELDSNGLYWGLGAGVKIMNDFVFEFVFSTNYYSIKGEYVDAWYPSYSEDMKSTALTFFVGYKFSI